MIMSNEEFGVLCRISKAFGIHQATIRSYYVLGAPLSSIGKFSTWYLTKCEAAAIRSKRLAELRVQRGNARKRLSRINDPEYRNRIREINKRAYWRDIETRREYERNRKREQRKNPNVKLAKNLRARLYGLIKQGLARKSRSALSLVGCSISELRLYLENQFKRGMAWNNYGHIWHIDHRIPCAKFDLTNEEQQRQCFHYLNLQPLFVTENLLKSDKILSPSQIPLAIPHEKN